MISPPPPANGSSHTRLPYLGLSIEDCLECLYDRFFLGRRSGSTEISLKCKYADRLGFFSEVEWDEMKGTKRGEMNGRTGVYRPADPSRCVLVWKSTVEPPAVAFSRLAPYFIRTRTIQRAESDERNVRERHIRTGPR